MLRNFIFAFYTALYFFPSENERKIQEQKAHEKWLDEREKKQQEMKHAQQLLLRSPAKAPATSDQTDSEPVTASPTVAEQLNVDVEASETRTQSIVAPVDAKTAATVTTTTPTQPPTPSSPLLTSLLQSPTQSGTPSAPKTPSSASKQTITTSKLVITVSSCADHLDHLLYLASPSAISPGLKNLVSAAISKEPTTKAVTSSPGSGAAAPTLTRLLEMPPSSPGKPLPEIKTEDKLESEAETVESKVIHPDIAETESKKEAAIETTVEESVEVSMIQEEMEVESQQEISTTEPIEEENVPEASVKAEVIIDAEGKGETRREESVEPASTDMSIIKEEPEETNAEVVTEVEVNVSEAPAISAVEGSIEAATPTKTEHADEEPVREEQEKQVEEVPSTPADEKAEAKETKSTETEEPQKEAETTTPKLTRRPLRGIRGKKSGAQETESPIEEKVKAAEPGPVTRRTRKSTQAEEHEPETTEEPAEAAPPSAIAKKKTSLPPLYVSTSSPAPSSGIESIPNSPTSSVSTVK